MRRDREGEINQGRHRWQSYDVAGAAQRIRKWPELPLALTGTGVATILARGMALG